MSAPESAAQAVDAATLRRAILDDPSLVLDDSAVMAALLETGGDGGRNVVDLRGALVSRLESRLDQLSRTHRSVIAAAYENLAGASQVHRTILRLLDAADFAEFLRILVIEAPQIVAVDSARLCLESGVAEAGPADEAGLGETLASRLVMLPEGGVAAYAALGDTAAREGVLLRAAPEEAELIWGDEAGAIRSEAFIDLDLGPRRGAIAFGSEDARRFSEDQGVDLVAFLGGAAARILRKHALPA
jgi:uncharacterized protein YigA (DUF484 family)